MAINVSGTVHPVGAPAPSTAAASTPAAPVAAPATAATGPVVTPPPIDISISHSGWTYTGSLTPTPSV